MRDRPDADISLPGMGGLVVRGAASHGGAGRRCRRHVRGGWELRVTKWAMIVPLLMAACSPQPPDPSPPRLPVPIRGADAMTLVRGDALERLIRGAVVTRAAIGTDAPPVERFAAVGDGYTLAYERPDTTGRYTVTPDRICLRFAGERSIFCRFYLIDRKGAVWMAEDDRDYPLHVAAVTITRG